MGIAACGRATQPFLYPNSTNAAYAHSEKIQASSNFRVAYAFGKKDLDATQPAAPLVALNGKLYGTSAGGGKYGLGTVYRITPQGRELVLHSFSGSADGEYPASGLTAVDGVLYGTAGGGGSGDYGTVFSITPGGSETTVYSFRGGTDGAYPQAGVIYANGKLYGTTSRGGNGNYGTVFSVTPQGVEDVLHTFRPSEGDQPLAAPLLVNGDLYGTASFDGKNRSGSVYRIDNAGTFKVLHYFGAKDDGAGPQSSLIFARGQLMGTTAWGGGKGSYGTVFSLSLSGRERVVHRFTQEWGGGYNVIGGLVSVEGYLHGTTAGTTGSGEPGTIYSIAPSGKFTTIHVFANNDYPVAGLTHANGRLYGTTLVGGRYGEGTVYVLTPP